MSFDEDQKKRGRIKRVKMSEIKNRITERILEDMDEICVESEVVWILQSHWEARGINPTRILDEHKGLMK